MEKRSKSLLLSIFTLFICAIVITGGTFALFTDTVSVKNRIVAGNLDVGLYRTAYQQSILKTDGTLGMSDLDITRVNLAVDNSVLFTVDGVVPTAVYKAELEVSNLGSTAFNYWVSLVWDDSDVNIQQKALASQIKITVESDQIDNDEHKVSFMLDTCNLEENTIPMGYILVKGDAEYFTITAEFLDNEANKYAMNATLEFDVRIYAEQKVS